MSSFSTKLIAHGRLQGNEDNETTLLLYTSFGLNYK
jgi:hypothetical protein